jgi:hypothetical protein
MKVKTSELSGDALNWAAAQCEGTGNTWGKSRFKPHELGKGHSYSTSWAHAGPIIERGGISIIKLEYDYEVDHKGYTTSRRIPVYGAIIGEYFEENCLRDSYGETYGEIYSINKEFVTTGKTPLIAAMRCYVASKLGDVVEIPDELLGQLK